MLFVIWTLFGNQFTVLEFDWRAQILKLMNYRHRLTRICV